MRRPLVALAVLSCLGLPACADGPTQTFNPFTGNPATANDGNNPGMPATTPGNFQMQVGGQNEMILCTADQAAKTWDKMVNQPMIPPRMIGGIDLAGGNTWPGLTIEQAEKTLCQSTNQGDAFGDGTQYNTWDDNGDLGCDYNVSNHLIYFCNAWGPGYHGKMTFTDTKGNKFSAGVDGTQLQMNNQNFDLDWNLSGFNQNAMFNTEINMIWDGLRNTFASGLPATNNCQASGACVVGNFGDVAYMFFPALGVGFWIASLSAGQPTCSTFNRIDMYLTKTLPYSVSNLQLKLDLAGPLAPAGVLGSASTACTLGMGLKFADFDSNCVETSNQPAANTEYKNELLGGLTHDTETYTFNVQGVDLNFKDMELGPTSIVTDQDFPQPADIAVNFDADQSTLGNFNNDFANNDASQGAQAQDWHGSGLVYLEYARLVQRGLNQYIPAAQQHPLGDQTCLWPSNPPPDGWQPAAGCTGFEGFITAAPGPLAMGPSVQSCTFGATDPRSGASANPVKGTPLTSETDVLALGPAAPIVVASGLQLGLKAGHPKAAFCLDANGQLLLDANGNFMQGSGYQNCPNPPNGTGDLMSTSFAQVLHVLGHDNVNNLPAEVQDVRFFWKQYATALIKYFEVAGGQAQLGAHENAKDLDAHDPVSGVATYSPVDSDDIFFDSIGAGQFEIAEYVDRRFASTTQPPTDVVFTADVKNGIFDEYQFSRELYRGENAIYSSVLACPAGNKIASCNGQTDGLGQEHNALLTNVFGSPLLSAGWTNVTDASGNVAYSAYYCATNFDPQNCNGQIPPLDQNGNVLLDENGLPLLYRYQAAFAGASTAFTLGQSPQPIKVVQTFDDIQQATVSVPLYSTYYDPTSALLAPLTTLIPWTPKQPGIGFPIALTGTLDKFIETSNLDFSGTTITASVDYDVAIDPMTMMPATDGSITFLAVETTDFLGDVFVCQAPSPTVPNTQDVLAVKMYTPVATILDWLQAHPGSYQNCGIIIRYSPYDNYADYITSLTNGVRLSITQGGGFGRVVDVTLFKPGQ